MYFIAEFSRPRNCPSCKKVTDSSDANEIYSWKNIKGLVKPDSENTWTETSPSSFNDYKAQAFRFDVSKKNIGGKFIYDLRTAADTEE